MDSKGKKIGILIVLCTLLVVMAAVVVVNYKRFMGGDSKAAMKGCNECFRTDDRTGWKGAWR